MEASDKIIEQFDFSRIGHFNKMPLICIYDSPEDYPGQFVARLWDLDKPTRYVAVAASLDDIRRTLPDHMVPFQRDQRDDPCIVEVWI